MYYEDLTPFEYHPAYSGLNIGWLDGQHPFPTGESTPEFLDPLFGVIQSGDFTRCAAAGTHTCEICGSRDVIFERNGEEIFVGNTEISIPCDGIHYIAPSLIYHYVADHHYLPPDPFVRGVVKAATSPPTCDITDSTE